MKKLLTLILCWLLAFSAIAETTFKAKTAASVAGGYVTSLNKVDGSFEDGTSQWVASADNIVKTASTEMQGNNIGVWTGTGTQTLDLQWIATASNTYEASAQVNVNGEDDVYICAYVGTTETGCKLIPALSKIQKVSVVADSVMSSAFYLRLKHTGSDAFNVKVDDGKIEPWTPQAVNLQARGTGFFTYTSVVGSYLNFNTQIFKDNLDEFLSYNAATAEWTAKKKIDLDVDTQVLTTAGSGHLYYINGSLVYQAHLMGTAYGSFYRSVGSAHLTLNAGDRLSITNPGGTIYTTDNSTKITFKASAISENVVQSWQPSDFLGEIKLLPSTTAPKGFIPADGKSIGKTSGNYKGDAYYALYALRWAMASTTAGEPYVISSAKGASAQADWDAGKTITIDVRGMFFRAAGGNAGAVGSKQSDAFQGHWHEKVGQYLTVSTSGGTTLSGDNVNGIINASFNDRVKNPVTDGTNGTPRVASETRPINTSEYAYMRYGTSEPTLLAIPTRSEVFSANVASAGTVTNATQNFVTSCTNAAPSVCSLWSNFGVTPICWSHTVDITKRAEVTATTATTVTVARTDTGTAFNLFCHLK